MLKQKQIGKKRKLYKFSQFIKEFTYHDFRHGSTEGINGYIYALDNPDEERLLGIIKDYDNTKIIKSHYRYAPEIVTTWLFIAD